MVTAGWSLTFTVPGEPVPKGRAKASRMGGLVRLYTPAKTRDYEALVASIAEAAAEAAGYEYPERAWYEVEVDVYRTYELKGGDADNYMKAVGDACNGVLWHDDSQIRRCTPYLAGFGANPRLEVRVRMLPYVKAKAARKAKVAP